VRVTSVEITLSVQFCKEQRVVHCTRLAVLEASVWRVIMTSYLGGPGFDSLPRQILVTVSLDYSIVWWVALVLYN
jgi:hypothetical protein